MNEAQTRKKIIDQGLKSAGWNVNDRTQVIEEYTVISGVSESKNGYNIFRRSK